MAGISGSWIFPMPFFMAFSRTMSIWLNQRIFLMSSSLICILKKSLHGLKQAPKALLDSFVVVLSKELSMKELGPLHYFLGIECCRYFISILHTQQKYAFQLLQKADMLTCSYTSTLVAEGPRLSLYNGDPLDDAGFYISLVGGLQYLTLTRPDLCFSVNYVSQFMHAPNTSHLQLVKRILRYVKGSICSGITFFAGPCDILTAYSDSDWAGCPDTRKFTSGYCIYLGNSLVSRATKKQPTISLSSTEAEYKSLALTNAELLWISYLLKLMHITESKSVTLYCDNIGANILAINPVFHARTKHVEINYRCTHDLVEDGFLKLAYVPSQHQLANVFTKELGVVQFHSCVCKLMHFVESLA
ncbi:uncharacterized protein LOC113293907 [Papaver somniferum]|uniref:uncharacterized protein LOC113293907 n=1 Tax=Papaver somniferum TaxID=3469 RepID=UPI000E6FF671|nr:uncharacterized protein LOC113293907 [Papaver somniferum]